MTDKLPPNLLALFAPRPPLRWVEAPDYAPERRMTRRVDGIAQFLPALEAYKKMDFPEPTESWLEAKDRKAREKKDDLIQQLSDGPTSYKPHEDPLIRGDPFKTLVVARLSYEATEQDLEREFARFGPIERIRIVTDKEHVKNSSSNKKRKPHRGYAFVVYEREKDMRAALNSCDGMRIKDRRIKVDVERGRTVKGWKPQRLGGGLGGRGYTKAMPARPTGPGGFGGFRGGYRGGFEGGRGRGGFRGGYRGGFRGDGGYRGDGDFRGDRGPNGYGAPHGNAPSGPGFGGPRSGGYGDRPYSGGGGGGGGGYDSRGSGRSYDDRQGGGGYRDRDRYGDRDARRTGSNMEPIRPRENGGYRGERDYDRSRDSRDDDRKRHYDGGSGYDEPRKMRRY